MSSEEAPSVFPSYIADGRFAIADNQHQAASVYILTLLCVVYSGIVLLLRGHLRWGIFGADDCLAAAATIVQGGEVAAVLLSLKDGVGVSFSLLSPEQIQHASRATFAADILFILSIGLAKCSVVFLMMRLFNLIGTRANHDRNSKMYRALCFALTGFIGLWALAAIIGLSVNCAASSVIDSSVSGRTCPAQVTRWEVIMALDVVTELFLVFLSIIIVWPLRLTLKMKLPVITAFAFRLPCVVLSILHFHYINNYVNHNPDGLRLVPVLNLMQVELCWSLISATIPNLKAFVKSFNSGFGLGLDLETAYGGSGGYGGQTNYELSRIGKSAQRSHNRSHVEPERDEPAKMQATTPPAFSDRPGDNRNNTFSMHEQEGSIASVGSQEQIIRKDVQWRVTYEGGSL